MIYRNWHFEFMDKSELKVLHRERTTASFHQKWIWLSRDLGLVLGLSIPCLNIILSMFIRIYHPRTLSQWGSVALCSWQCLTLLINSPGGILCHKSQILTPASWLWTHLVCANLSTDAINLVSGVSRHLQPSQALGRQPGESRQFIPSWTRTSDSLTGI